MSSDIMPMVYDYIVDMMARGADMQRTMARVADRWPQLSDADIREMVDAATAAYAAATMMMQMDTDQLLDPAQVPYVPGREAPWTYTGRVLRDDEVIGYWDMISHGQLTRGEIIRQIVSQWSDMPGHDTPGQPDPTQPRIWVVHGGGQISADQIVVVRVEQSTDIITP